MEVAPHLGRMSLLKLHLHSRTKARRSQSRHPRASDREPDLRFLGTSSNTAHGWVNTFVYSRPTGSPLTVGGGEWQ